ncbi:MAG: glycosyltransferase family 39 protein [Chloroflexota bacterium]
MNAFFNTKNWLESERISTGLFIILLFSAVSLYYYTTTRGVGASPDSAVYIGVANNLLAGMGLQIPFGNDLNTPLTQYPPLYPALIALTGIFSTDYPQSIRFLNLLLLSANLMVFWLFAKKITSPNVSFASLLIAPSSAAIGILTIHIMAWSEALFILLGFGGLYFFATTPVNRMDYRFWVGALLLGLSALTRYAGIAFIFSAFVFMLLHPGINKIARRIQLATGVAVIGLLLPLIWLIYNQISHENAINRSISFHPMQINSAATAIQTVSGWIFLPDGWSVWLKGAILLVALTIIAWAIYRLIRRSQGESPRIALLLVVFLVVYVLFLVVSISWVDANTPLDNRILSPVFISTLLLFGFVTNGFQRLLRHQLLPIASFALLIYPIVSLSYNYSILENAHQRGIGFFSTAWAQSEAIAWVKQKPARLMVFSNSPEAIYLNAGVSALPLPKKMELMKNQTNPDYAGQLIAIGESVQSGESAILFFNAVASRNLPSRYELISLSLTSNIVEFQDGFLIPPGSIRK